MFFITPYLFDDELQVTWELTPLLLNESLNQFFQLFDYLMENNLSISKVNIHHLNSLFQHKKSFISIPYQIANTKNTVYFKVVYQ